MKKVLIVEDRIDSIIPIVHFLEGSKYTAKLAFDGMSAMNIIHDEQFEKIIVDWNMPILDGKNFLISLDKFLKKHNVTKNSTSYAIYTSSDLKESDIPHTEILKFNRIISKNMPMSERVKQLNSFLENN